MPDTIAESVVTEACRYLNPKLRAATLGAKKAALQNAVTATDHQIDQLVYELYGLPDDEIKLVEGGEK